MTLIALTSPSDLLQRVADDLDIPPEQRQEAVDRYDDLGRWLREAAQAERDITLYPQGSMTINTTNRNPIDGRFDVDGVFRIEYLRSEIGKAELKALSGGYLGRYVRARQEQNHRHAPGGLDPKRRTWRLWYANRFHMDVLPVIPDETAVYLALGDPLLLADKALRQWQPTNPKGFAQWFNALSYAEFHDVRLREAAKRKVDVEQVPPESVKTTLQRAVQILKRHRDQYFSEYEDRDLVPPSILITTLAGRAYEAHRRPGDNLFTVIRTLIATMPEHLERRNGKIWVPNPTNDGENFADRIAEKGEQGEATLHAWLRGLEGILDMVERGEGLHRVAAALDEGFGPATGQRVIRGVGAHAGNAKSDGRLQTTSAGSLILATGGTGGNRPHTFHGDPR